MLHATLGFLISGAIGFFLSLRLVADPQFLKKWELAFCWVVIIAWLLAAAHVTNAVASALSQS